MFNRLRKKADIPPSAPPESGRLLCLNCRHSGHAAIDCREPIGVFKRHEWFRSKARGALRFGSPGDPPQRTCERCKELYLLRWLDSSLKRIETEEQQHNQWPPNKKCANNSDWVHYLGSVESIKLWKDCLCCRCIFALTPEPSSLEQDLILYRTFSVFRLEQGIKIDTKQKRDTSTCVSVILEKVNHNYNGFSSINEIPAEGYKSQLSGDALCFVENNPKKSRARIGARAVSPARVTQWLSECSTRHLRTCRPIWNENLKRILLVDVGERKIVSFPTDGCDYIALSYVWGGVDQSIPEAGTSGGSLSMRLPTSIEDAMSLVKRLGKRYLWVDSICIDQSDNARKLEQIGLMGNIYQGAYMTIIAMSGTSANAGLARVGVTQVVQHQARCSTQGGTVVGIGPTLSYLINQVTWAERGWTFQEAILSQRCLYITEFQAYWECNAMHCCESLDVSQSLISQDPWEIVDDNNDRMVLKPEYSKFHTPFVYDPSLSPEWFNLIRRKPDPQDLLEYKSGHVVKTTGDGELRSPFVPGVMTDDMERLGRYCTLVEQYKRRALSFESDALNAFAGVLQAMEQSEFSNGFLLGLPVAALQCVLLWEKADASTGRDNELYPSWTWASWTGRVRMELPDAACRRGVRLQGSPLGRYLMVWQKGVSGITTVFSRSPYDYSSFPQEYMPPNLPPENAECFQVLKDMSYLDAKNILCVQCYHLSLRLSSPPTVQSKPTQGYRRFSIPRYGDGLVFSEHDGSEPLYRLDTSKERKYLVITASMEAVATVFYLLCIEPAGHFWKRVKVLQMSVDTDGKQALHMLRPRLIRILLI